MGAATTGVPYTDPSGPGLPGPTTHVRHPALGRRRPSVLAPVA